LEGDSKKEVKACILRVEGQNFSLFI